MVSRLYWTLMLAAFASLVAALPRPATINRGRTRYALPFVFFIGTSVNNSITNIRECGVKISEKRVRDAERRFRTFRLAPESENATGTVDIYFHVVHANQTFEGGYLACVIHLSILFSIDQRCRCSDKQIHDQVDVMNRDYNSTGIRWQLKNINRIENEDWFLRAAPDR